MLPQLLSSSAHTIVPAPISRPFFLNLLLSFLITFILHYSAIILLALHKLSLITPYCFSLHKSPSFQSSFASTTKMTGSFKPDLWRPWESAASQCTSHECEICCSLFRRFGELKRHRESCHSLLTRKCTICNEEFTRKDNLTRHMKNKHVDDLAVKPKCEFCFKRLSRQDAAARHQKNCHKNPRRMSNVHVSIQRPNVIVSLESLKKRQTG